VVNGLTNVVSADRNLLDIWLPGMTQCNCNLCSPQLHMLMSTVQCFVRLSRFVPYPCYPYPEPEVHHHLEYQSMPIKTSSCKSGIENIKPLKGSYHRLIFFLTLYHANGIWFCAINDPCIHSTELAPSKEFRFICSPFRPT
jgi:hypothetical protein